MVEISAKEILQNIDVEVFPIPDMGDNEKWKNYILTNLPNFDYIISGNAWVQDIFKDTNKQIIPLEVRKIVK